MLASSLNAQMPAEGIACSAVPNEKSVLVGTVELAGSDGFSSLRDDIRADLSLDKMRPSRDRSHPRPTGTSWRSRTSVVSTTVTNAALRSELSYPFGL